LIQFENAPIKRICYVVAKIFIPIDSLKTVCMFVASSVKEKPSTVQSKTYMSRFELLLYVCYFASK